MLDMSSGSSWAISSSVEDGLASPVIPVLVDGSLLEDSPK